MISKVRNACGVTRVAFCFAELQEAYANAVDDESGVRVFDNLVGSLSLSLRETSKVDAELENHSHPGQSLLLGAL